MFLKAFAKFLRYLIFVTHTSGAKAGLLSLFNVFSIKDSYFSKTSKANLSRINSHFFKHYVPDISVKLLRVDDQIFVNFNK